MIADEPIYSITSKITTTQKRILSIGCGEGAECVWFAKNGAEVVGIDASNELIALARRRYGEFGIDFLVMDYEKTRFEDAAFDGIVSIMSLMYILF